MKEIDARGMACPAPVLQTKAAITEEKLGAVTVTLDSVAAQENVQRFLESQGYQTHLEQEGSDYRVIGTCESQTPVKIQTSSDSQGASTKIMVMCTTDRMGFGDDVLGQKLMVNFLSTLKEMGPDLWRLVFVNNGVKLTIDGSHALEHLKELESKDLKILVCGTCLTHFNLLERKQVGETTNMLDIVTAMQLADKVINL